MVTSSTASGENTNRALNLAALAAALGASPFPMEPEKSFCRSWADNNMRAK